VRFNYIRKSILLIFLGFFILQACSTVDLKESSFNKSMQIKPGRSYEECVELFPNQIMQYSFTSSDNVNFNIHYHDGESILYPVNKKNITFWKDSISPDDYEYYSKEQKYFCLMWNNLNNESIKITFNYNVNTI
jgi:hypothetical protein